jgi:hypothetical protein
MLRQLGLVLLNYLEPPSALAFPPSVKINDCFGRDESHITGVFMKDSFWYELYKACSEAIPAHLLHVVTQKDASKDSVARVPSPIIHISPGPVRKPSSALELRQKYGIQVQDFSHGIMGMNLRIPGDRTGGASESYQSQIDHPGLALPRRIAPKQIRRLEATSSVAPSDRYQIRRLEATSSVAPSDQYQIRRFEATSRVASTAPIISQSDPPNLLHRNLLREHLPHGGQASDLRDLDPRFLDSAKEGEREH